MGDLDVLEEEAILHISHAMPGSRCQELYYSFVENEVKEGTVYVDDALSDVQRSLLTGAIERLRTAQDEPDYHPHSDNKVRDLVHPALYAYVVGESPFFGSQDLPEPSMSPRALEGEHVLVSAPAYGRRRILPRKEYDMWGREYEESKYQWLPTYFSVASDCKVRIEDYINGIARAAHPELYLQLEALFERFVPLLEHAWSYGSMIRFQEHFGSIGWERPNVDPESPYLMPLRGSRLQVITKIVDYELQPGQEYEGAWHVEGIPNESIVATALYIASRDEGIQGGNLCFKRSFDAGDGDTIYNINQEHFGFVDAFARHAMFPAGQLETPNNRMLVFPNSHVHKEMKMINAGDQPARCRIVVFFLVNPLVRVVSTKEVPDQRNTMSLERAKEHRLELMRERALRKQDWSVRPIELP
mmetsp:Transcript_14607/g.55208  ORF Transcript_14607/g.55208 Transcript_14607/m.55208 type:complete len:415 (-) Transcript_14607:3090-4334(-)